MPLYELVLSTVLSSSKVFADDTTLPVLDPGRGRTKTGRLWCYAVDDRPWNGPGHPMAAYVYSEDRKNERPAGHLANFRGVLQVDGYDGFKRLAEDRSDASVTLAFCWVHTPIITANDAEGAGAMFRVSTLDIANGDFAQDFFGRETHLTVSGQLNVEAYCLAMSRVYTFGPTFRAENSNTARHLAEFWMVEPEIAFADLSDDANLAEACLKYVVRAVLDERDDDMAFFAERIDAGCIERLEGLVASEFERMDYTDAVAALSKAVDAGVGFEFPVSWGMDLQSEHERYLTEQLVGRPVVVMNYPKDIKAFYMRVNDDGRTVAAMDVLAPGIGEIIGGSQREERLDVLDSRIDEIGLDRESYWWYRDLRRYGTVPHAGFGLGFERTVAYITGMANVRDVIPFPRTPRNADF